MFLISLVFILASFIIIIACSFNWGIDLTGGVKIEIKMEKSFTLSKVRKLLHREKIKNFSLRESKYDKRIIIHLQNKIKKHIDAQKYLNKRILKKLESPNNRSIVKSIELIGPSVGKNLIQNGLTSIILALVFVFVYINFRFGFYLALGAISSLVHDLIITVGLISLFQIKVDSMTFASLMSVTSYSLNDTIVHYDRIRENFQRNKSEDAYYVINLSLTQTFRRTLITLGITLIVVTVLLFFGGPAVRNFSLTMLFGVLVGTISSVYIAAAIALSLGLSHNHVTAAK